MIEPFIRHGLKVDFYPVVFENKSLHIRTINIKHDVTLVLDYFGFNGYAPLNISDTIVIRDLTHSLLSENLQQQKSDYCFASFRKWGAVAGAAVACKSERKFRVGACLPATNEKYISLRKRAYALKSSYINGEITDKHFLELFNRAEELLEKDYADYPADNESIITAATLMNHSKTRRENAAVLLNNLSESRIVTPLFPKMRQGDVPLFVPVLVNGGRRDALKKYLIENGVYCPTHWPLSDLHNIPSDAKGLYEQELSLICDQRYTADDMKRIVSLITEFENRE